MHLNIIFPHSVGRYYNKEFLFITQYSRTQLYFTQQYSRTTTTCFDPICGSSSSSDLTFGAAIKDVWGVLLGQCGLGEGNEISFEIRINYQLDAIEYLFLYFSSTCFGLIRPSTGAMDVIISFTYAAYGVLGVVRCRS